MSVQYGSSYSTSLESLNEEIIHSVSIFSPYKTTKLNATSQLLEALDLTPLKVDLKSFNARKQDYITLKSNQCAEKRVKVHQSSLIGEVSSSTNNSELCYPSADANKLMLELKERRVFLKEKKTLRNYIFVDISVRFVVYSRNCNIFSSDSE